MLPVRISALVSFLLLLTFSSFSQSLTEVRGTVTDAETSEGLPGAGVSLAGKPIGTATNAEGVFLLRLPQGAESDQLTVSYVGYEPYRVTLSSLKAGEEIAIKLKPSVNLLTEVEVTPLKGRDLVMEAVRNIPQNYPAQPQLLEGFYRELIKEGAAYKELTEAVLHIYKTPYSGKTGKTETDQVKLLKGRRLADQIGERVQINISGGAPGTNGLDFVNRLGTVLDPAQMKNYDYEWTSLTSYEGKPVYVISFDQKPKVKEALLKGTLYLDQASMAIIRIKGGVSPRGLKHLAKMGLKSRIVSSIAGMEVNVLEKNFEVNYRPYQGKWYFHQASAQMKTSLKGGRKAEEVYYDLAAEMLITKSAPAGPRFPEEEVLRSRDVLSKSIGSYDADFWKNYTIIEPSAAVKAIGEKLEEK